MQMYYDKRLSSEKLNVSLVICMKLCVFLGSIYILILIRTPNKHAVSKLYRYAPPACEYEGSYL